MQQIRTYWQNDKTKRVILTLIEGIRHASLASQVLMELIARLWLNNARNARKRRLNNQLKAYENQPSINAVRVTFLTASFECILSGIAKNHRICLVGFHVSLIAIVKSQTHGLRSCFRIEPSKYRDNYLIRALGLRDPLEFLSFLEWIWSCFFRNKWDLRPIEENSIGINPDERMKTKQYVLWLIANKATSICGHVFYIFNIFVFEMKKMLVYI